MANLPKGNDAMTNSHPKIKTLLAALLWVGACTVTHAFAGQATVIGNSITSKAFPVGSLTFVDPTFTYVGSTEFVLYDIANCEIHVFAELDGIRVKRFYWVQFEGYLSGNNKTYDYRSNPKRSTIGGHAFHERVWFRNTDPAQTKQRAGSDSAAVQKLFDDKGLKPGPEVMMIRLVRLDDALRRELMIIYAENLDLYATPGSAAADFNEGGKLFTQREAMTDGLRQRALAGIRMKMN